MTEFKKLKERMLKKPGVRKAYDEMAPEYAVAAELIRSRIKAKMTQAQVAKRMKTTQSAVARMESGASLPSMTSITKYATATGEALSITIEPTKRRQKAAQFPGRTRPRRSRSPVALAATLAIPTVS